MFVSKKTTNNAVMPQCSIKCFVLVNDLIVLAVMPHSLFEHFEIINGLIVLVVDERNQALGHHSIACRLFGDKHYNLMRLRRPIAL